MNRLIIQNEKGTRLKLNYKKLLVKNPNVNIVLCHGFASDHSTFTNIYDKLSENNDCYGLDLPGHGFSEAKINQMKLPFLATAIEQFLEKLNLNNVVLIGHSLGGGVISYLHDNKRVKGYIFITPINPAIIGRELKLKDILLPTTYEELRKSWNHIFHNLRNIGIDIYNKKNLNEDLKRIKSCSRFSEALALDVWKGRQWEIAYNYLSIEKPSKIILTENDLILPFQPSMNWLSKLIRGAEISIIKQCGHSPHREKPLETAQLINNFIESLIEH